MNSYRKALFATGSFLLMAAAVTPSMLDAQACTQQTLGTQPSRIGTAVWTSNPQQIAVTSPKESGEPARTIIYSPHKPEGKVFPNHQGAFAGAKLAGRYVQVVQNSERSELHWLDGGLESYKSASLWDAKATPSKNTSYQIRGLYMLTIMGDQIFAYGSFGRPGSQMEVGFFRATVPTSENEKMVPDVRPVMHYAEYDFYVLGNPYLTSLGHTAYFLLMDRYPELWAYDMRGKLSPRPLRGFPGEEIEVEPLNADRPSDEVYLDFRNRKLPFGLYSQGSSLYSLHQQPEDDGSMSWTLARIRPDLINNRVEVTDSITIPTKAERLVIVPSPKNWYIFERFADAGGEPRFSSLLTISSKWLVNPDRKACDPND